MQTMQYLNKFHRFSKYEMSMFDDTQLYLKWESKDELRMEFRSLTFARIKSGLFAQYNEVCSAIRPFIMRKSSVGILSTAVVGFDNNKAKFSSGGVSYTSEGLVETINKINSPEALRTVLFGGELTYFLATIESIYVYLFLSAGMSMTASEIAEDLKAILDSDFEGFTPWHLKSDPTLELIHYFLAQYQVASDALKSM